jgi:predicted DNA-binding protein
MHASVKRTNINIREYQHKALAELSKKTGPTVSELVRQAIDGYLKKRQSEK